MHINTALLVLATACSKPPQDNITTILTNNAAKIWLYTDDLNNPVKDGYHYYILKKNGSAVFYMLGMSKKLFHPLYFDDEVISKKWSYENGLLYLDGDTYKINNLSRDTIMLESTTSYDNQKNYAYLIYSGLDITY